MKLFTLSAFAIFLVTGAAKGAVKADSPIPDRVSLTLVGLGLSSVALLGRRRMAKRKATSPPANLPR